MNRESYEQMIAAAKVEATETMGHNPSPQRVQHALDVFAKRVATATRTFHLSNLMSVEELAQHLGKAERSVRDTLDRRHASDGIGRRVGKNTWLIDIDELPLLQQDRRKKNE